MQWSAKTYKSNKTARKLNTEQLNHWSVKEDLSYTETAQVYVKSIRVREL